MSSQIQCSRVLYYYFSLSRFILFLADFDIAPSFVIKYVLSVTYHGILYVSHMRYFFVLPVGCTYTGDNFQCFLRSYIIYTLTSPRDRCIKYKVKPFVVYNKYITTNSFQSSDIYLFIR